MVTKLTDVIQVKDRQTLLRFVLYFALNIKKDVSLSDNELNVLSLFIDNDSKDEVIDLSIGFSFVRSKQSGENTVSKLVKMGILKKKGINKRVLIEGLLPENLSEQIISNIVIHNIDADKH